MVQDVRTSNHRLAIHMGVSVVLFLAAVSGWGAFAYVLSSDRQKERTLQDQVSRATTERDRLGVELKQVRAEVGGNRQALEQARRDLVSAQQQVVSFRERLKLIERAPVSLSTGAAQPSTDPSPPVRQLPGAIAPRR